VTFAPRPSRFVRSRQEVVTMAELKLAMATLLAVTIATALAQAPSLDPTATSSMPLQGYDSALTREAVPPARDTSAAWHADIARTP
jgi:hypothetical protein